MSDANLNGLANRPLIHSSLARSLYDKMMREQQLRSFDRSKWYKCDAEQLSDVLREKFLEMDCDEETNRFIESCYKKSDWLFTQMFHSLARAILCVFMTSTSVNGFLGRGSMFVFSKTQIRLLHPELTSLSETNGGATLLDLGAGDGEVTRVVSDCFSQVYVTEVSPVMKKVLTKKGFQLLDAHRWHETTMRFDVISCLNVLDRCDKPITMLKNIKAKLKPNGVFLLALVLPLSQFVENSSTGHRPNEVISVTGSSFEEQVSSLYENVLKPNGFELVKWTKLPYLCEGDMELSFYWLNDVVMVLKAQS